jgi:hypothetical protein
MAMRGLLGGVLRLGKLLDPVRVGWVWDLGAGGQVQVRLLEAGPEIFPISAWLAFF